MAQSSIAQNVVRIRGGLDIAGPMAGNIQRHTLGSYEAETCLRAQLSAADRGEWLDPTAGHPLFGEWVGRWQTQRLHLAPSTAAPGHIANRFPCNPEVRVSASGRYHPGEVAAWVAELSTRLSPTTTRKVYELFAAMEAAVAASRIGRSPGRGVKLPRLDDREEMRVLNPVEVAELAAGDA